MKRKIAYIEKLREIAPQIAITFTKEIDESFRWDGDGPDPVKRGYFPHDVYVRARVISQGEIREAETCLGGSYYRKNEPCGEIHGYLPQMIEEALTDLLKPAPVLSPDLINQIVIAVAYMKDVMRKQWGAQQMERKTA